MGLEELAGLAIALAGTGLSTAASVQEKNAMNTAAERELSRQRDYAHKGQNVFEQSLSQSTPDSVNANQNQGAQRAMQEYTKLQGSQAPQMSLDSTTINPKKQFDATQNTLVEARTGQQNQANATLQGYNNADVLRGIKDLQANSQLNQIGRFASASNNVLPLEMQAAQNSQSTMAGIGSLMGTVGGLMGMAGATSAAGNVTPLSQVGNYPGTASMLNSAQYGALSPLNSFGGYNFGF